MTNHPGFSHNVDLTTLVSEWVDKLRKKIQALFDSKKILKDMPAKLAPTFTAAKEEIEAVYIKAVREVIDILLQKQPDALAKINFVSELFEADSQIESTLAELFSNQVSTTEQSKTPKTESSDETFETSHIMDVNEASSDLAILQAVEYYITQNSLNRLDFYKRIGVNMSCIKGQLQSKGKSVDLYPDTRKKLLVFLESLGESSSINQKPWATVSEQSTDKELIAALINYGAAHGLSKNKLCEKANIAEQVMRRQQNSEKPVVMRLSSRKRIITFLKDHETEAPQASPCTKKRPETPTAANDYGKILDFFAACKSNDGMTNKEIFELLEISESMFYNIKKGLKISDETKQMIEQKTETLTEKKPD